MTDKILPQIEDWQKRPLDEVYPILFIDAIHYSVRDNGVIRETSSLCNSGNQYGRQKEVLTIQVGNNESFKYWLAILNELKNRGVKYILLLCADGLSGIKEAVFFVKCFSSKKASEFPFFSKGFSLLSAGIMHPCA